MLIQFPIKINVLFVYSILNVILWRKFSCRTIDWRKLTTGFTYRTISTQEHPGITDFYDYHNDWMLQFLKRGPYCTYCTCARCNSTTDNSWIHSYSREKQEFITPPVRFNKKTRWKDPYNYGYDSEDIEGNKTTMFKFARILY